MKRVPGEGIRGVEALREAQATELRDVMALVARAVQDAWRAATGQGEHSYSHVESIFPDHAIVHDDTGRYWRFPYTISDDNTVTVGEKAEVVREYKPVVMREARQGNEPVGAQVEEAGGVFIEALPANSSDAPRYLVRVIRAGVSGNGVDYPAAVLREAAPLFNGVRVFAKGDAEHIEGKGKDFRQLVGRLVEARYVDTEGGEIQAVLEVLQSADVAAKLREAVERGMTDLFGLSIDAEGTSKKRGKFREATAITKVASVDLIIEPGAGGQVIRFVESLQEPNMKLRQQMLDQIRARDTKRADQLKDASDEEVLTAYREALAAPALNNPTPTPQQPPAGAPAGVSADDVDARIRMVEARAEARTTIAASGLPAPVQERLVTRFREAASFTAEDVTAAIEDERTFLGRLVEGAQVRGLGDLVAQPGEDRADKVQSMLDDFFDPTKPARSFREAYVDITGDRMVTGMLANCDRQRLAEAIGGHFREAVSSTTFSEILGDSITRAMIRAYGSLEAYGDWRWLCDVVPVSDFREQNRTRLGGYGDLPAVAENAAYNPLTTPTDEVAKYAVTKRGGTETISLEAIANDDVGLVRRIPLALATAAGRTLYEFVYDFLRSNAVIYDGVALFHGDHDNLGTAALDATSFAAARLAMLIQAEQDSGKRLGITLRHLVVPPELEETAYDLFVRNTNNDDTFVQSRKPRVHVAHYFTDSNNWYGTADNAQVPLIELGFYGGEEPQLFVQDNPTQGSLFSNDQIKYKIRHIYSGAVRDYRGFYGAIVAGG
ncbi:MAG TPA: Mu-like prophage major head subunit gpT family protein [Xanthomonadaceae bacterium]|nr:Mu-like prophage major head subunit gpT family protein [Xanthomonadaceae bacterium]